MQWPGTTATFVGAGGGVSAARQRQREIVSSRTVVGLEGERRPARDHRSGIDTAQGSQILLSTAIDEQRREQVPGDRRQDHEHQRAPAGREIRGPAGHPKREHVNHLQRGQAEEDAAGTETDVERYKGKRENGVQGQAGHLAQGIFRLTAYPLGLVIRQDDAAVAHPGDHAAQETMELWHGFQGIHSLTAEATKIRRAGDDLRAADAVQEAVKSRGGELLEGRGREILSPLRLDNIIALAVQLDHLNDHLRRVLTISIHRDDKVALGGLQPGR